MKKIAAFLLIGVYGLTGIFGFWLLFSTNDTGSSQMTNAVIESPSGLKAIDGENIELMARTVYGEARGEEFEGQVAVAAVIINRLKSRDFPDDVEEIIYEPLAFTAVNDGQINLGYDAEAYQAVQLALQGHDPTGGALYYYNPEKSTSDWIWTRKTIKKIGKHVFAI